MLSGYMRMHFWRWLGAVVKEKDLLRIPSDAMPLEQCAMLRELFTAYRLLEDHGNLKVGGRAGGRRASCLSGPSPGFPPFPFACDFALALRLPLALPPLEFGQPSSWVELAHRFKFMCMGMPGHTLHAAMRPSRGAQKVGGVSCPPPVQTAPHSL